MKGFRSGDFPGTTRQGRCSRFLTERLRSLLHFREVLIIRAEMNWIFGITILVVIGFLLDREIYFYEGVRQRSEL